MDIDRCISMFVLLWFSLLASVTINSHRMFSHVLKFDGTRLINWNVTSEVENLLYWILSTAFTKESCLLRACLPSSMRDLEKGNEVRTSILQSILQTVTDL
ncbi:hypothetical protein NC652_002979 [Populus alba x Populus x berolinensis]|nr:hypothetical protein NC652_002979 [Populus alba x Populus x berolinensis]